MNLPPGFQRHIDACNRHDLTRFAPFIINGRQLGWVRRDIVDRLAEFDGMIREGDGIALSPALNDFAARSDVLAQATERLAAHYGKTPRREMYAVIENWGDAPLAQIDRVAVPWFGLRGFGIHVNGFTIRNGEILLWIGARAMDRLVDPGKLDNLVGGGQPIGLTLAENLAKEAWEEAGIDAALAATARPAGEITYTCERPEGLRRDTLFVYDLELPPGFTPRNTDGEVAAFHLMSLSEVAEIVATTDRFKFNCNLVVMGFLKRKGLLAGVGEESF